MSNYEDRYELVSDDDNVNQAVETKINILIEQFANALQQLAKQYPDAGIGDTATDEAIANELYSAIH